MRAHGATRARPTTWCRSASGRRSRAACRSRGPARMVAVLRECGALARVLPEVEALAAGDGGGPALGAPRRGDGVRAAGALRLPHAGPRARGGGDALRAHQRAGGVPRPGGPRRAGSGPPWRAPASSAPSSSSRSWSGRTPSAVPSASSGSWKPASATCAPARLDRQVPRERSCAGRARRPSRSTRRPSPASSPQSVPAAIHAARAERIARVLPGGLSRGRPAGSEKKPPGSNRGPFGVLRVAPLAGR